MLDLLARGNGTSINAVEMYLDRFSQQYVVEAGGVAVYDTCEKYKAQAVYDYLLAMDADALSMSIADVAAADADQRSEYMHTLEFLAGAR